MDTPGIFEQTSLERLKTLDSLPSLAAQIDKATELCTHGARAEMILRWVTEQLRKSADTGSLGASWKLLSIATRLLPPHRVAVLLASTNFQAISLATFSHSHLSQHALIELQRFFKLLLDIGNGSDGAPVKALVRADSAEASEFCGAWFSIVFDNYSTISDVDTQPQDHIDLDVALDFWALRRRQPDDDALFTKNCLLPMLGLLSVIRTTSRPITTKRRHLKTVVKSPQYYRDSLRSLLARHCVLPARALFTKERNSTPASLSNEPNYRAGHALQDITNALNARITEKDPRLLLTRLPLLLEAAVLSVPTPSPRHRDREQSWLEYLFLGLRAHVCSADLSYGERNTIIIELLDKIHPYGSLSPETLSKLVRSDALRATNEETPSDLLLVVKVIQINVDIFLDNSLAELLFDTISAEAVSKGEDADFMATITGDILSPVMNAFARARRVAEFVALWKKQLLHHRNDTATGIWEKLSQTFADLLEPNLTHEQILEIYTSLHSSIAAAANTHNSTASEQLDVDLILSNAVLCGIQSDELLNHIQKRLNETVQVLFEIADLKDEEGFSHLAASYWTCLTTAFKLCFPIWQSESEVSRRETSDLTTNRSFQAALTLCSGKKSKGPKSSRTHKSSKQAEIYTTTVCSAMSAFDERDDVRHVCTTVAENITNLPFHGIDTCIAYPNLETFLKPSRRKRILVKLLKTEEELTPGCERGLTLSIWRLATPDIKQDLITILIELLQAELNAREVDSSDRSLSMEILNIPADAFAKDQRLAVLKILFEPNNTLLKNWTAEGFRLYIQALWQFLQPADALTLCHISSAQLWKLVESVDCKAYKLSEIDYKRDELFEQIARQILSSWLNRQHEHNIHEVIVEFTENLKLRMRRSDNPASQAKPGTSAVIKVFMDVLDEFQSDKLTQSLSDLDLDVVHGYIQRQLEEAARLVHRFINAQILDDKRVESADLYETLMDARAVVPVSSSRFTQSRQQLAKMSADLLGEIASVDTKSSTRKALVQCAEVVSEFGPGIDDRLSQAFKKLLELDLTVFEREIALSAYAKAFEKSTASVKISLLGDLSRQVETPTASRLLLLRTVISRLTRDDAEATMDTHSSDLLQHTLLSIVKGGSTEVLHHALGTTYLILREKSFMVNQYGIERVVSALQALTTNSRQIACLYVKICQCVGLILVHYRSRVQDRLHLIVSLLQALLSRLFHVPGSKASAAAPTVRQATALTRVLVVLCNRRPKALHRNKSSELVDEAREVQARTGQYMQHVLHRYCTLLLTGSLGQGMRDALKPGLWSIIEAVEVNGANGIKALSAAMNNSERAVLRSVYDDWKRFGKWEGL